LASRVGARVLVNDFLARRHELACEPRLFGTTVFPRLQRGSAAEFVARLQDQFQTNVVPGEFFEQPQHFRIGISVETATLQGGLEQLGAALDGWR
jgi:aspartate/methionine/tyrosine aminotransferase